MLPYPITPLHKMKMESEIKTQTKIDSSINGKRVSLLYLDDPHPDIKTGDQGTVEGIIKEHNVNLLCVNWDNGSKLRLIQDVDTWKII